MSGNTARYGFLYPTNSDATDIPYNIETPLNSIDSIIATCTAGAFSALPPAGIDGRFYYVTSGTHVGVLFFDNGTAWEAVGPLNTTAGNITTSNPGDTVLAGNTGLTADAGHRHAREAPVVGQVIAAVTYNPGPGSTTYPAAFGSLTALDTTNLTISGKYPASGNVRCRLQGNAYLPNGAGASGQQWGLLDHTTHSPVGPAVDTVALNTAPGAEVSQSCYLEIPFSGTPGATFQIDWAASSEAFGSETYVVVGGGNGPGMMTLVTA